MQEYQVTHVPFNPVEAKPVETPYDSIRHNLGTYLAIGSLYAALMFGGLMAYWQLVP